MTTWDADSWLGLYCCEESCGNFIDVIAVGLSLISNELTTEKSGHGAW